MSDKAALAIFMEKRRQLIIRLQKEKGLKASGFSAGQLNVREDGSTFNLVDSSGSFEYQEFGRRAGKAPPFQKIYDWLQYKKYKLDYKDDEERVSIAWGIITKIKKEGTYTHRTNKPTGVLEEAISKEATQELTQAIAKNRALEIKTDIKRIFT